MINISKKYKISIAIILISVIGLGYHLSVYNAYHYQSSNNTLGGLLIIISFIIYPLPWIDINKNKLRKILFSITMTIIALVVIIQLTALRHKYEKTEIASNPAYAEARIVGFESSRLGRRSRKRNYATISYYFNNKEIIQRIEYHKPIYKRGQIIKVRFSSKYPEMFEVQK